MNRSTCISLCVFPLFSLAACTSSTGGGGGGSKSDASSSLSDTKSGSDGSTSSGVADVPPGTETVSGGGVPGCKGGSGTPDECDKCMTSKCDAEARAAFGNGYMSGNFTGGACADLMTCMTKCDCSDSGCQMGCAASPPEACKQAAEAMETCQSANCASLCKENGGGGGSADAGGSTALGPECSKLKACCDDPSFPAEGKSACNYTYGEMVCKGSYDGLVQANYCK